MEVSVLTNSGLPEGCILSIRSGTIRRQAPVDSGKAFKFPEPLSNPLKFDLFMPLASGHLVTRPGEEQYKVDFAEGGAMNCELQVKPSDPSSVANVKSGGEELKKDSSAAGAKEFLEQHSILEFVQAVLHTIITERPKDPYMEMARHFMCGYKGTDKRSDPAQVQKPADVPVAVPKKEEVIVQKPVEAPVAAPREEDKVTEPKNEVTPTPPEIPKLPLASKESAPEVTGVPEIQKEASAAAPEAAPEASGEELRLKMKDKLLSACDTGELQTALETVVGASGSGSAPQAGAAAEGADDDLRTKMRTCLLDACESGQLSAALETIMPPLATAEAPKDAPADPPKLADTPAGADPPKPTDAPADPPKQEASKEEVPT